MFHNCVVVELEVLHNFVEMELGVQLHKFVEVVLEVQLHNFVEVVELVEAERWGKKL